jgi:multidrug efflux pump subunit AcrA (membrane-fusion protein)
MMKATLLALVSATLWTTAAATAATDRSKPAPVFATDLKPTALSDAYVYPARVEPKISSIIVAETDGVVTRILAPLGQSVARRQRLMIVQHTDPVYQYAPVSVTSPVSGIVSQVKVSEGSQVSRGQELAMVTDPKSLRVMMEVPAQDLGALHAGMEGEFRTSQLADPVRVRVRGVSPSVDPATGTAGCELEFVQAASVAPGQLGQASFQANARSGFVIPEDSIFYRGNDAFVRMIESGRARYVAVSLGRRSRGNVEILKGLSEGGKLILRTSRYVTEGEAVEVTQ